MEKNLHGDQPLIAPLNETDFRQIANVVPVTIWLTDRHGHCTYLNKRWTEITGLSENESTGIGWLQAVHPEDRLSAGEQFAAANEHQTSFRLLYRLRQKNGHFRYVFDCGEPKFDQHGAFDGFAGTIADVHEQIISEQRFEAAVNAVEGIIWTNNAQGQMEGVQKGWSTLTGQSYEEYQGYGWSKAVHPDDAQASVEAWREAVREKKTFVFEHRVRRHDESWGIYSIRAIPLFNDAGDIREWVGVHTDITAQRHIEQQIRDSEAQHRQQLSELENVYRNAPIGLALIGRDYRYLRINERLAGFNGIPVQDHLNRTFREILPDLSELAEGLIDQVVASKQELLNVEIVGETKAEPGVTRVWNESWYPILSPEGEVESVSVLVEDITLRRQAEKVLRENEALFRDLADSLDQQVKDRTKALQRSNEDLQQFAHVASHDLKEPVRKILMFGNRLREELAQLPPEKILSYLSKIEGSAQRMYSMIEGILLYSTIDSVEQTKEPVKLNEVLQGVVSDLEISIHEKGATVEYHDLPDLNGSLLLISQLFYNLINNSLKFARPDVAPVITLRYEQVAYEDFARFQLSKNRPYVKIVLTDNGIGFREKENDKIFEAFTRLHSKDKYEGTGLGLSLCKKIVERHHGAIWAEGIDGEGATFYIVLPLRIG